MGRARKRACRFVSAQLSAIERSASDDRATLTAASVIEHRYRLPPPTWHGHEQVFYQPADPGLFVPVDLVVMKVSAEEHYLERERPGDAVVLLDRDGLVVAPLLDRAAHDERMRKKLTDNVARFPIFSRSSSRRSSAGSRRTRCSSSGE